jgi:hypothetical protein
MPMPYGPMRPETLAKRRATAAGKAWGFARWTREQRAAVQALGVAASKPYARRWTRAEARAMSAKAVAARQSKKAA